MQTEWLRGLKDQQSQDLFKRSLLSSREVLDKLKEICYNKSIEKGKVRFTDYDVGAWSEKQAHINGYLEALDYIQTLVAISDQEKLK